MGKLLLLSIILGSIAIPARAARQKNPRIGMRKTLVWLAAFNLLYVISLRLIWHRL